MGLGFFNLGVQEIHILLVFLVGSAVAIAFAMRGSKESKD